MKTLIKKQKALLIIISAATICFFLFSFDQNNAKNLIGKWKLVKITISSEGHSRSSSLDYINEFEFFEHNKFVLLQTEVEDIEFNKPQNVYKGDYKITNNKITFFGDRLFGEKTEEFVILSDSAFALNYYYEKHKRQEIYQKVH